MTESGIQASDDVAHFDLAAVVGLPLDAVGDLARQRLAQVLVEALLVGLGLQRQLDVVVTGRADVEQRAVEVVDDLVVLDIGRHQHLDRHEEVVAGLLAVPPCGAPRSCYTHQRFQWVR
jgi:hypothetical protein